jgi:hypothetical protein
MFLTILYIFAPIKKNLMSNLFKNKYFLVVIVYTLSLVTCFAQSVPPPDPSGRPGPGLPIDGGILLLSIIAVVYGVSKKK